MGWAVRDAVSHQFGSTRTRVNGLVKPSLACGEVLGYVFRQSAVRVRGTDALSDVVAERLMHLPVVDLLLVIIYRYFRRQYVKQRRAMRQVL